MDEKKDVIFDFDINLICELFCHLDRQGPGSEEVTRQALSFIRELPADAVIADLGCGTGGQTVTLARNTTGTITAVDLLPGMIEKLNQRVKQQGLEERITGVIGSMEEPPFREGELDLIWAEGSIYHVGFEKGLTMWRDYLKPGGYFAVSEMIWLTDEHPAAIDEYMTRNCPEINTASYKLKVLEQTGYIPVAAFLFPESCWTDTYFRPLAARIDEFLEQHDSEAARQLVHFQREDISFYEQYKQYYGYMFFIGRKPEEQAAE